MRKELSRLLVTGDWDRFARESDSYWKALARHLRRRWDVPEAVEEDDVKQELLLGAIRSVEKYDPERGDAWTYVRWRAEREARRWLNKQRQAKRYSDCGPSRYPLRCEDPDMLSATRAEQPIQERVAAARERIDTVVRDAGHLGELVQEWVESGGDTTAVVGENKNSRRKFRKALNTRENQNV
jgi:RNA polymerase sigma factor (sigma-70 family)